MMIRFSANTCHSGSVGRNLFGHLSAFPRSRSSFNSRCYFNPSKVGKKYASLSLSKPIFSSPVGSLTRDRSSLSFSLTKQKRKLLPSIMSSGVSSTGCQLTRIGLSSRCRGMSLNLLMPKHRSISRISWNVRPTAWILGGTSAGVCVSFSTSEPVYAEASMTDKEENDASVVGSSHGKKVYTDYSITGIPGDGRCLFRSVVHGACIRSGKPWPNETLQRELADELRASVADEFVRRRAETEWFIEGDFNSYVSHIRKPHVWGGEPELFMASHVLQMPITVYMNDEDSGGLISIAEYGQEYGKDNPIRVLYHGFGHYDALQIPGKKGAKSRL